MEVVKGATYLGGVLLRIRYCSCMEVVREATYLGGVSEYTLELVDMVSHFGQDTWHNQSGFGKKHFNQHYFISVALFY